LAATLKEHPNQGAVVAIENNGYPHTTTMMQSEGFISLNMYMLKKPRIQKKYIMQMKYLPAKKKTTKKCSC
jgi:hypothetical protein